MKARPSEFMGGAAMGRKPLGLPTIVVTKKTKGSAKAKGGPTTAYAVDSLDRLVAAFDENERALSARSA